MTPVTAVIVTHNSEEHIASCVEACLANGIAEVLVVDNASGDGTLGRIPARPEIRTIAHATNNGFAAAVNHGIHLSRHSLVLLLNPDAVLLGGLPALIEAAGEQQVAAAGGMLVDSAGRPQRGFNVRRFPTATALSFEVLGINRLWPANPSNRRYRYADLDPGQAADIEQPAGAFLLLRKDAWMKIGGLDEGFHPVWFEDVDYCKRLHDAGFRIRYVPEARACHGGGHSVGRLNWSCRQSYWYVSLLKYASRHLSRQGQIAVCASVVLGSVPRAIWGIRHERSLKPLAVYSGIVSQAFSHWRRGPGSVSGSDKWKQRAGAAAG